MYKTKKAHRQNKTEIFLRNYGPVNINALALFEGYRKIHLSGETRNNDFMAIAKAGKKFYFSIQSTVRLPKKREIINRTRKM